MGLTGRLHLTHEPGKGLWGRHLPSWDPSAGLPGKVCRKEQRVMGCNSHSTPPESEW